MDSRFTLVFRLGAQKRSDRVAGMTCALKFLKVAADNSFMAASKKIRIERPTITSSEEERLWREVHKYADLIPAELEPNMGRLQEIKDEIKKGIYIKPEMIEETAARLAIRLKKTE